MKARYFYQLIAESSDGQSTKVFMQTEIVGMFERAEQLEGITIPVKRFRVTKVMPDRRFSSGYRIEELMNSIIG